MSPPSWREGVAARPRHVLLFSLVAGLLGAPAPAAVAVGAGLRAARLATAAAAAGAALAVVAGGALADARREALGRHALPVGQEVRGEATLLAAARTDARGDVRAAAALRTADGGRGRVLLRAGVRQGRALWGSPGAVLDVAGRLGPPDRGALAARAHATLRVDEVRPTGRRRGGLAGLVDGVRDRASAALARGLPPADGALLQGMVLGQDAALPDALREDLRAAGLAHLVAASGQNVLLLAALGLLAGAVLGVPVRPRLVLVLLLVALYVPLAGAGPSIQRAGIMGAAGLAAALAGRPAARWYAVGLAAAGTLLLDPRSAGDPGWQMSFAAVVALALLARPLAAALRERRVPRGVAEATAVALVATLATAPVAALHFGRASLLAVPANVVVAPVVAPVMWLGMAAAALGQVAPVAAAPLVTVAAPLVAYVRAVGTQVAQLPGAEAEVPAALVTVTAGAVLVVLGRLAVVHARERRRREAAAEARRGGVPVPVAPERAPVPGRRRAVRVAGAAAAAALAVAWLDALVPPAAPPPPGPGVLRLTFLDVGQGDATLVQSGDAAVLVDAGPPGARVAGLLRAAGVDDLDALVVSHDAADHHGGVPDVARAVPTALVLDGREGARASLVPGARTVRPVAGQVLRAGPLELRVLWPPPGVPLPGADPNDRAVVLEARAAGSRALLPADAESPVLQRLDLGDVDVLKVSHHGSRDEGLPPVVARLRPEVAVISAGRGNRYGHPAPQTLAALAPVARVLRTDRDGTAVVEARAGELSIGTRP